MKTTNEKFVAFVKSVSANTKTYKKLSDLNLEILTEVQLLAGSQEVTSFEFLSTFRDIAVSANVWPMKKVGKQEVIKPVPVNEAVKAKIDIALTAKRVHNWLYNTVEKPARDAKLKAENEAKLALEKEEYENATKGMTDGEISGFELALAANISKMNKMEMVKQFVESMGNATLAIEAINEFLNQEK